MSRKRRSAAANVAGTAEYAALCTLPKIALQECGFCGAKLPPSKTKRDRCSKHTPVYGVVPQNDISDDITQPVPVVVERR